MTYQFPLIRHLDDLLAHVSQHDYICDSVKEDGTIVVSYIFTDKNSFASNWERECRGITFDKDGNILSRTLHKFFNLGEKEAYHVDRLDFSKIKAIFPKLDGSMISTYVLNDKVTAKSKNSPVSDVALQAQAFIDSNSEYLRFCRDLFEKGLTPTFEFTSPNNRIVVKYEVTELTLLQVRDNVTGQYLDIHELSKGYDIKVLSSSYSNGDNFSALLKEIETMEGVEGFIVMFEDGDMVKIKTPWYIGLHHSVTFKRYRDIARLVVDETLDDFRGFLALQGYDAICVETIDMIERKILEEVSEIKREVLKATEHYRKIATVDGVVNYSEAAKAMKIDKVENFVFSFVMNELRGKSNDYLYHYKSRLLKDRWGLETIPTGLEVDETL
jgi:T4 RnlA family RNA ligase